MPTASEFLQGAHEVLDTQLQLGAWIDQPQAVIEFTDGLLRQLQTINPSGLGEDGRALFRQVALDTRLLRRLPQAEVELTKADPMAKEVVDLVFGAVAHMPDRDLVNQLLGDPQRSHEGVITGGLRLIEQSRVLELAREAENLRRTKQNKPPLTQGWGLSQVMSLVSIVWHIADERGRDFIDRSRAEQLVVVDHYLRAERDQIENLTGMKVPETGLNGLVSSHREDLEMMLPRVHSLLGQKDSVAAANLPQARAELLRLMRSCQRYEDKPRRWLQEMLVIIREVMEGKNRDYPQALGLINQAVVAGFEPEKVTGQLFQVECAIGIRMPGAKKINAGVDAVAVVAAETLHGFLSRLAGGDKEAEGPTSFAHTREEEGLAAEAVADLSKTGVFIDFGLMRHGIETVAQGVVAVVAARKD